MTKILAACAIVVAFGLPLPAWAWGDEGHEIVALIAEHFLAPDVRVRVATMLNSDTDSLTQHDIAHAATWADKYRDSNKRRDHYRQTHLWHFVDIELDRPDIDSACFGYPAISGAASNGPEKDCITDKIDQFARELRDPHTDVEERVTALKFALHFVGDVHQPLHAADNHDQGGNAVKVAGPGPGFNARANLHSVWDTLLVERLGRDPKSVADALTQRIAPADARRWAQGNAKDWALESFSLARDHVYRFQPVEDRGVRVALSAAYLDDGVSVVAAQLSKAGVRLAAILNSALGSGERR